MRAAERWLLRMVAWFYGEVFLAGVALALLVGTRFKDWFRS